MRTVRGNDAIFDQMIRGKDEIVYNLIFSRREAKNTLLLTDDHSCIITQSREPKPVVVFLNGHPADNCDCFYYFACIDNVITKRCNKYTEISHI